MERKITVKKLSTILFTLIVIIALGIFSYGFNGSIKKFFGFATVYYSFWGLKASNPDNNWVISTSSAEHYAWGETTGWIDFAPTNGDIFVADDALWGYAYGENVGWLSLNCHNTESTCSYDYGVANDGEGNLSGYAWGENVGWINFAPTNGGVRIDANGNFSGYAWGENVGWISFNCSNTSTCGSGPGQVTYKVATNWRHQADRPQCNNGLDDDGDTLIDFSSSSGGDTNCSSLTDDNESSTVRKVKVKEPGTVLNPIEGTQWVTGNTYTVSWKDVSTTTVDVFVYMLDGGYGASHSVLIATLRNTDSSFEHFVSDVDLPKYTGATWKIAVCSGELVGSNTDNCGLSGSFEVVSIGKPVEPKATSTKTTTDKTPIVLPPIHTVTLPVTVPEKLVLKDLPVFGTSGKGSTFSFIPQMESFLFAPLPKSITDNLDKSPKLKEYLASVGFSKVQDLISLAHKDIYLKTKGTTIPGLFIVSEGDTIIRSYLSKDADNNIFELVRVASGTTITVSVVPINKDISSGNWMDTDITFGKKNPYIVINLNLGGPGRYMLKTKASPLPLAVEVVAPEPSQQSTGIAGQLPWLSNVLKWFGR